MNDKSWSSPEPIGRLTDVAMVKTAQRYILIVPDSKTFVSVVGIDINWRDGAQLAYAMLNELCDKLQQEHGPLDE